MPQGGAVAFAAVDKGQKAIADAVARLRRSLDPNAATLGDIPAFDVGLASSLYDELLKPVEAGFAGADSLLVVPHDVLGQLPFAVLVTQAAPLRAERQGEALFANYRDVAFLVRKAAITQLHSVAALSTLRGCQRLPLAVVPSWASAIPCSARNRQPRPGRPRRSPERRPEAPCCRAAACRSCGAARRPRKA